MKSFKPPYIHFASTNLHTNLTRSRARLLTFRAPLSPRMLIHSFAIILFSLESLSLSFWFSSFRILSVFFLRILQRLVVVVLFYNSYKMDRERMRGSLAIVRLLFDIIILFLHLGHGRVCMETKFFPRMRASKALESKIAWVYLRRKRGKKNEYFRKNVMKLVISYVLYCFNTFKYSIHRLLVHFTCHFLFQHAAQISRPIYCAFHGAKNST